MRAIDEKKGWGETLPIPALAATAIAAWAHASGVDPKNVITNEAWSKAWLTLAGKFDGLTDILEGKPVKDGAAIVHGIWRKAYEDLGGIEPDWDGMSPMRRLAWEAVTRHLAMVIEAEDAMNLPAEEANWKAWVERRLAKEGMAT